MSDVIMLNLALLASYLIRFQSGLFDNVTNLTFNFYVTSGIWLLLTSFFIFLFALNGLYTMYWDISRFDKVIRISRVIIFGTVVLFFITLDPEKILSVSRINIVVYAGFLIILINLSRLSIIFI